MEEIPSEQEIELLPDEMEFDPERYERVRQKLIRFFAARRLPNPENLADETIYRALVSLKSGKVEPLELEPYLFRIAQNVAWEEYRRLKRIGEQVEWPPAIEPPVIQIDQNEREAYLDCLDECWEKLEAEDRELLERYYAIERGADKIQRRQEMSDQLQIGLKALRSRLLRIRRKLEKCIEDCVSRNLMRSRSPKPS